MGIWLGLVATAAAWTLGDVHDLAAPAIVEDPLFTWALERGTVFPVLDDDERIAGFVWVGEGHADVELGRRAEATANRMVALMDWPVDAARHLSDGGRLRVGVDGAVVLGLGAWDTVAGSARRIHGDDVLYTIDEDGLENILVLAGSEVQRAERHARRWLDQREAWWDEHLVEPAGLLDADRWERDAGTGLPPRWVASWHTDTDWGLFAGDLVRPRIPQPWLEVLVDPSGVVSPGDRALAWAFGTEEGRVLAAEPFPGGGAPVRLDLVGAGATARFDASPARQALELGAVVDLGVVAVGGPITHAVIDLPHTEQQAWRSMPPLPEGFELLDVLAPDGTPLEHAPISIGRQDEYRGEWRSFAVRLPEVLQAGQAMTLRVRFRDRHRFSHVLENQLGMYNYGAVTELVPVLPVLRGNAALAAPVQVQVGVAPDLPEQVEAVAAGREVERWESETGRWVRAEGVHSAMQVAAGRWFTETRPGEQGLPTIVVRSLHANREQRQIPRTVDGFLNAYQPILPDVPLDTITIVEGVSELYEPRIEATHGLIQHHEVQDGHEQLTWLDPGRLTWAMVQQWWLGLEVPARDADLPAAVAEVYALEGVRVSVGEREATEAWHSRRSYRAEAPGLAWTLGPTLAARTGSSSTFFRAVDSVLRGEHPPSREGLRAALEEITGEPWDGFFEVWLDTGLAPTVEVAWTPGAGDSVSGTITTDLPFGRVDVPLQVGRGRNRMELVVPVVDGTGTFAVVGAGNAVRVDPDELLPLRASRVRRHASR